MSVHSGAVSLGNATMAWAGTRRIPVAEFSVRYREAGRGPVVVLVHGLGMSADYWFRNGPALAAAGFRVLAPDLPGFGQTSRLATGLSVPQQAEALLDWARAMRLPPAVYVGHSLACQSVLEMAARSPETVRALVLAAPTGSGGGVRRALRQLAGLLVDATREPLSLFPVVLRDYLRAGPGAGRDGGSGPGRAGGVRTHAGTRDPRRTLRVHRGRGARRPLRPRGCLQSGAASLSGRNDTEGAASRRSAIAQQRSGRSSSWCPVM